LYTLSPLKELYVKAGVDIEKDQREWRAMLAADSSLPEEYRNQLWDEAKGDGKRAVEGPSTFLDDFSDGTFRKMRKMCHGVSQTVTMTVEDNSRYVKVVGECLEITGQCDLRDSDRNFIKSKVDEYMPDLAGVLKSKNDKLVEELAAAVNERDTANQTIQQLQGDLTTTTNERDSANLIIRDLQNELVTANNERDSANLIIRDLQNELVTANNERDAANHNIQELQDELLTERGTANQTIQTLHADLDSAHGNNLLLQDELATANETIQTLQANLNAASGDNTNLQDQLDTANTGLQARDNTIQALQGQIQTLQAQVGARDTTIQTVQANLVASQGQLIAAHNQIQTLQESLDVFDIDGDDDIKDAVTKGMALLIEKDGEPTSGKDYSNKARSKTRTAAADRKAKVFLQRTGLAETHKPGGSRRINWYKFGTSP
jgi:chromosome segregation ATPase